MKRTTGGVVAETLERSELVTVQTPQAFVASVLRSAIDGGRGSDRLRLARRGERGQGPCVEGDERLLKVTTPADLERVAAWL